MRHGAALLPELGFHPKEPTQTQCRIRRNRSISVNNFANTALGNADVLG
jgi:hypothetical protein